MTRGRGHGLSSLSKRPGTVGGAECLVLIVSSLGSGISGFAHGVTSESGHTGRGNGCPVCEVVRWHVKSPAGRRMPRSNPATLRARSRWARGDYGSQRCCHAPHKTVKKTLSEYSAVNDHASSLQGNNASACPLACSSPLRVRPGHGEEVAAALGLFSMHYGTVSVMFGAGLLMLWLLLAGIGIRQLSARAMLSLTGHLRARPDPWLECTLRKALAEFDHELTVILHDRGIPVPRAGSPRPRDARSIPAQAEEA